MNEQKTIYRLGDRVRIMAGPFAAFSGRIDGINQAKALLKVKVEIFGRNSHIKVRFSEAQKLEFTPPPRGSTEN